MNDIYKSLVQSKIFLSPTQLMRGSLEWPQFVLPAGDQNVNTAAPHRQVPSTVVTVPSSWTLGMTHVPGPADPEGPAKVVTVSRVCICWRYRLKGR